MLGQTAVLRKSANMPLQIKSKPMTAQKSLGMMNNSLDVNYRSIDHANKLSHEPLTQNYMSGNNSGHTSLRMKVKEEQKDQNENLEKLRQKIVQKSKNNSIMLSKPEETFKTADEYYRHHKKMRSNITREHDTFERLDGVCSPIAV